MSSFFAAALKAATLIGSVGTVATLGEAIGKRVGVLDKGTNVLIEGANIALDMLGAPKNSAIRPSTKKDEHVALGEAPAQATPGARAICVECQNDSGTPLVIGSAGEEVILGQCQKHYEAQVKTQSDVAALYDGWAQSLKLGASACGNRPSLTDKRYRKSIKGVQIQDPTAYYRDLSEWQTCTATESADKAAAAQAAAKQTAAAKQSQYALSAQARRYKSELAKLKASYASEKDAAAQAKIQEQIAAKDAQIAAAEKIAEGLRGQAKDAETQAKIDQLQATINALSAKPGGMDAFMQLMMQQMLARMAPATPVAASEAVPNDPLSMLFPAEAYAQPTMSDPGVMVEPVYDDGFGFGFNGYEEDAEIDPDLAEALGMAHGKTYGDADALLALRQGGFGDDELEDLLSAPPAVSGCSSLGSCGAFQR